MDLEIEQATQTREEGSDRETTSDSYDQRLDLIVYLGHASLSHSLPLHGNVCIGRSSWAQVRIDDASVSREHLLICSSAGRVEIEDLGSSNGTFVFVGEKGSNDRSETRLKKGVRRQVQDGDVIRIGSVVTVLRLRQLRSDPGHSTIPPDSLLSGSSLGPEMRRVYELAMRAAATNISVLIMGETGTGKELLASHVHQHSTRSSKDLLRLNCAALSESLLESELFGHEKGAFTGATTSRVGLLASCKGGTVFLDELGEMPLGTQGKLLRVLEERRIRRLGSNRSTPIDVRFVAATNRDIEREVAEGRFRGDLFYRISGMVLRLPPLRERPTEIEPLARYFLREAALKAQVAIPELTDEAVSALLRYSWPGNVRELKNAMDRAPILSAGGPIGPEHLLGLRHPVQSSPRSSSLMDAFIEDEASTDVVTPPPYLRPDTMNTEPVPRWHAAPPSAAASERKLAHKNSRNYSDDDQRMRIVTTLKKCRGNQTRAAELLGVSRRTLINRLDRLGIPRPRKGSRDDSL